MTIASALLLLLVNAATVLAFGIDKQRAIDGGRRISEARLLWLAAAGGTPGALWARRRFRHKTRKQPFSRRLEVIATVQAGMLAGLVAAWW